MTIEEWQLLSFFEAEPTLLDAHVPWCYNHAVYEVRQGPLSLSFAIDPAYCDVRIGLDYEATRLCEFNAKDVQDVRWMDDGGQEHLIIDVNDHDRLVLRIKPHIELTHHCEGRP